MFILLTNYFHHFIVEVEREKEICPVYVGDPAYRGGVPVAVRIEGRSLDTTFF